MNAHPGTEVFLLHIDVPLPIDVLMTIDVLLPNKNNPSCLRGSMLVRMLLLLHMNS